MIRRHALVGVLLVFGHALTAVARDAAAQDRFMAPLPPDADVTITRDVTYATVANRAFKFDLYRPRAGAASARFPVVIFLNGVGGDWMRGHVQYSSWPRYVTKAGLAGISMDAGEGTTAADFDRLVKYLGDHAAELGIDPDRLVVWSCSANVGSGLPLVQDPQRTNIVSAVVYYGSGTVSTFRLDLPLLIVRAGTDNPGLNRNIDRVVAAALTADAPVTVMTHPAGRHGFDLRDDDEVTREIMAQTLTFMARTVTPESIAERKRAVTRATAAAALFSENWAAAAKAYEALAAAYPKDPEPPQRLGEALMALNDERRAVPAFERSLELGTNNVGIVNFALVRAHTHLGQIDRALARLEKMKPYLKFFINRLQEDADLAPLRADPRFKDAVSRLSSGE
jgi:hypothetical protein